MQSSVNSDETNCNTQTIDKTRIAEVVSRRHENTEEIEPDFEFEQERDLRQQFRRLVDPGLARPNSKKTLMNSLKTLSTIAGNLLAEPENPKYQRFKPTNTIIKKNLVEVPGALEYAIAMGFRAEVENFQPYYVHSERYMKELRIGAFIIAETLERENFNTQRAMKNMALEKEAREGVKERVKMNYLDDRKEKKLRDEMERQRRQAIAEKVDRHRRGGDASTTINAKQNTSTARELNTGVSNEQLDLGSDVSDE